MDIKATNPELKETDPRTPERHGASFHDQEGVLHNLVGTEEIPLSQRVAKFNPQEGTRGRDGGPYLDDVERMREEQRRAYISGTSPKWENVLSGYVEADQLVDNHFTSNPGSQYLPPRVKTVPADSPETSASDVTDRTLLEGSVDSESNKSNSTDGENKKDENKQEKADLIPEARQSTENTKTAPAKSTTAAKDKPGNK